MKTKESKKQKKQNNFPLVLSADKLSLAVREEKAAKNDLTRKQVVYLNANAAYLAKVKAKDEALAAHKNLLALAE